jgi:hypothetical protein
MKMSVAEQPELMGKGMELMNNVLDGGKGLVLITGAADSLEITLLQRYPWEDNVTIQQRVGAEELLSCQERLILGA